MTLDDAVAHVGRPVIAAVPATQEVRSGEIERVDAKRQLVLVRLRRVRAPYDFTGRKAWYAPCHLHVPEWWLRRQTPIEVPA